MVLMFNPRKYAMYTVITFMTRSTLHMFTMVVLEGTSGVFSSSVLVVRYSKSAVFASAKATLGPVSQIVENEGSDVCLSTFPRITDKSLDKHLHLK